MLNSKSNMEYNSICPLVCSCPFSCNYRKNVSYIPQRESISFPDGERIGPAAVIFGGFAAILLFVLEKFGSDVYQYADVATRCAKKYPYDFNAIEKCLREAGTLSGADASRVRNRMEQIYNTFMAAYYAGSVPEVAGIWKTHSGFVNFNNTNITRTIPFPRYAGAAHQNISGTMYKGSYRRSSAGILFEGELNGVLNNDTLYGWWNQTQPKVARGNFLIKFSFNNQYIPIFTGSFGVGPKYTGIPFSGTKTMDY